MKTIIVYIIYMFLLGFAILANTSLYAESDVGAGGLVEKLGDINQDIRKISEFQSKSYKGAVKAMSKTSLRYQNYAAEVNDLNRQFSDIVDQYKPEIISWEDFKPIEYYQIDKNDKEALEVFIDEISETRDNLKNLQSEMKELVQDIRSDNSSYEKPYVKKKRTTYYYSTPRVYYNYPSYRYVYPRSDRSYYYGYPYIYGYDGYYSYPHFGVSTGLFNLYL